jgi:hypothetical protein
MPPALRGRPGRPSERSEHRLTCIIRKLEF